MTEVTKIPTSLSVGARQQARRRRRTVPPHRAAAGRAWGMPPRAEVEGAHRWARGASRHGRPAEGYFGVSVQMIRLPIVLGEPSSLPTGSRAWIIRSTTFRPSSMWAASRPLNTTEITTLFLCSKNSLAWLTLTSRSWSPVLGRTRISLIFVEWAWFLCCRLFCWY